MRIALVYQAGIANVFELKGRRNIGGPWNAETAAHRLDAKRLLQSDFRSCEWYCRGLQHAGALVQAYACNMAGDVSLQDWTTDLESQPFHDKFGCAWMQDARGKEVPA